MKNVLLIVILLLTFVGCNTNSLDEDLEVNTTIDESPPAQIVQATETERAEPLSCEQNKECFLNALRECDNASGELSYSLDLFGVNQTILTTLRSERNNTSCILHYKSELTDIRFSQEVVRGLRQSGLTDDEIRSQLVEMERAAFEQDFPELHCFGPEELLVELVREWQNGMFSSSPPPGITCPETQTEFQLEVAQE